MSNWIVYENRDSGYLRCILDFLNHRFAEIFGNETMSDEECVVYNDPNAETPMLIISGTPIMIRLAQPSLTYWAQTIFQLSHEMCHYAIRQHKPDKDFTLKWFEEIACEAASLYFLSYSAKHWKECELSRIDPGFNFAIEKYLDNELNKPSTDSFQKCDSAEKIKAYNEIVESDRQSHRAERKSIYYAIMKNPMELKKIVDYEQYLNANGVTIDFGRWIRDNNCEILRAFAEIMPVKP